MSLYPYKWPPLLNSSRQAEAHDEVRRKAYDVSGRVGFLYNIKTDRFVESNTLCREPNWYISNTRGTCDWWWHDKSKRNEDLLGRLEIEDELYLLPDTNMCDDKVNERVRLINYDESVNQRTIFLWYSYSTREQYLPKDSFLASIYFPSGIFDNLNDDASHIVHGILWGFEVLFVIQIPDTIRDLADDSVITRLLNNFCDALKQPFTLTSRLTKDEQNLWSKLDVHILATSPNLSFNQTAQSLSFIYRIERFISSWRLYEYPLVYILQPVKWIYHFAPDTDYQHFGNGFSKEPKQIQHELCTLHNVLNQLLHSIRLLHRIEEQPSLSQFTNVKNEVQLEEIRRDLLQNLLQVLISIHHDKENFHRLSTTTTQEFQYDQLQILSIDLLLEECEHLYNRVCLIDQLRNERFENQQIEENDNSDLFYYNHEDIKDTNIISSDSETTESMPSQTEQVIEKTDINVLLLGESGVGKSTFINAFVNYLTFDSLEQAAAGEPVVLIPVSFLLTFSHNFQEFVVKFGDTDRNEDHDHPGQSVTQDCRSYVFDINDKFRLRLIDTPGIGDTRGLEQDTINTDRILSYINNFSHINAVCILLQPNITRLNVFFRTCILQLFTYLTPAARDNIIFCFTNTRLAFFAPGNTAPTLKSFLKELPMRDIPFIKKNSFCFDSESFRYLAAVKNNFYFDDYQQEECHKSWAASVMESERLFKFIYTLKPYQIAEWKSEKHAEIEINKMIRPIMEAFRTVLFNRILQEQQQNNIQIILNPQPISDHRTVSGLCYRGDCGFTRISYDDLCMIEYPVHQLIINDNTKCISCSCAPTAHLIIDYELKYSVILIIGPVESIDDEEIARWLNLCIKYASFLNSDKMFLFYFDQFITEERFLATVEKSPEDINYITHSKLHDLLSTIKNTFQRYIQTMNENKIHLDEIYELINSTKAQPIIKVQLDAIKQGQEQFLKNQERFIEIPSQCSGILVRLAEETFQ